MSDNNVLSRTTLALKRQEMKDRGGINWLIDLFINEVPNYLNELQQALASGDGETLYLAAHKFKGSSSNLGAIALVDICKQVETLARAEKIEQVAFLITNELPQEAKRLMEVLEREKLLE